MEERTRRSVLAAGAATIWLAGCTNASTDGDTGDSQPSQTGSPTETEIRGGRVGTTTSDARQDLVVYNQSDSQRPVEIVVRNRDGERTFEKELTLRPKGADGDRWFRSETFSRDSGVLWENERDEWTIDISTDTAAEEYEFIYGDGNRVHVHIFARTIEFGVIE